ncbi:nitrate- and nitrite sensing domain-containing protein [Streptomyces sp. NPDC016309]|uniref:sensor histidine kinase n=1 Tax=Streptomyces sp. NPDC016309 TaxID=3364965 RepID=UPI003700FB47
MQGRFKRDGNGSPQARQGRGEAAAEQEPRGGTDRGSSPQHTQNPGPATAGDGGGDRAGRSGAGQGGDAKAGKSRAAKLGKGGRAAKDKDTNDAAASPAVKNPTDAGSRIALRNWRISTRLVSLLALPVVAATTLGGIRINESMNDMEQLDHMQLLTKLTQEATNLAQALQEERDLTAGPLSNGVAPSDYKVAQWRTKADRARDAFLDATTDIGETEDDEALQSIRSNVEQIARQVVTLGHIRGGAYNDKSQDFQTVERYNRLINSLLSLSQDMAQATSNPEMIKRTRALAAFSSAKEYASIQRAVIAAALPTTNQQKGALDPNDREYGAAARENERQALDSFALIYSSLGGDPTELMAPLGPNNPSISKADAYAEIVLRNDKGMDQQDPRGYLDWTDAYAPKMQVMDTIEASLLGDMDSTARELRQEEQRDAIINGALILLVLGVSLVGAFVVARSMIRSLRRLQDTATKVAQERLPELVKQLSEADPQDVDTSVESVGVHSRDEIGQVAAAFDDVHREAVRLAAEQALLRGNVNAMFTNLSRRSQGLIQRQLSLISELESREADPDQLSSLFKLDHLATRMRRNGENLLVLAGEEPGRRWTRPVPLVDVLRAAASEVEQYERIELASVPATEVAGRVVNDLVHLLAELLENATSFSSPQTKVRVTGHALPDGRVLVEIHDTGIGLSPEDLAAINERLASPPTVDVSVSRRMGLFVVGRLSLRHGIRIQLRPSDSGGTTALVMLPVDVAQGGKKLPGKPGQGGPGGQGAMPQGPSGPGGRLTGGPGAAGGGRPGLAGGPGAGGPGGASAGRHGLGAGGAGGARGQVGAGAGSRPALPGRDEAAGRPGAFQGEPGQGGPQGGRQGRPGQGQGAPAGRPQQPQQQPQDPQRQGAGATGAFGGGAGGGRGTRDNGIPTRSDVWQNGPGEQGPRPGEQQAPLSGGPRAELPGAAQQSQQSQQPQRPQQQGQRGQQGRQGQQPRQSAQPLQPTQQQQQAQQPQAQRPQRPQTTSWGADVPRGHEEPETTGQYGRPSADRQGHQDPASTAQFARPDYDAPRPQAEALPPAPGAGDGRTPLYDTLETNWFHQNGQAQQAAQPQAPQQDRSARGNATGQYPALDQTVATPAVPQQPVPPARPSQQRPAPSLPSRRDGQGAGQGAGAAQGTDPAATTGSWRTSPNDELVRQAERVRKPAAGGVTTSGLPRRVPRANLVPGTAQESAHQTGPQVSRAPDDVRGRLTNLRRGIQQGRQAGSSTTGSFPLGPTHQQER